MTEIAGSFARVCFDVHLPSIKISVPVTNPASSEQASAPISSTFPHRVLVHALQPPLAIMHNGTRKGALRFIGICIANIEDPVTLGHSLVNPAPAAVAEDVAADTRALPSG